MSIISPALLLVLLVIISRPPSIRPTLVGLGVGLAPWLLPLKNAKRRSIPVRSMSPIITLLLRPLRPRALRCYHPQCLPILHYTRCRTDRRSIHTHCRLLLTFRRKTRTARAASYAAFARRNVTTQLASSLVPRQPVPTVNASISIATVLVKNVPGYAITIAFHKRVDIYLILISQGKERATLIRSRLRDWIQNKNNRRAPEPYNIWPLYADVQQEIAFLHVHPISTPGTKTRTIHQNHWQQPTALEPGFGSTMGAGPARSMFELNYAGRNTGDLNNHQTHSYATHYRNRWLREQSDGTINRRTPVNDTPAPAEPFAATL